SLAVLILLATPVPGALSPIRTDLLLPRNRIRGAVTESDYKYGTKESYEAYTKPEIDSDVQADIDVDTAATEAATDVGVEVGIGSDGKDKAKGETESRDKGTIKIEVDRVLDIESAQREQEHGILAASEKRTGMLDRIRVLKRDNMCVKRERVDGLRRHMSYTQDKLRQMRVSRYYDRAEFRRLDTFAMRRLALEAFEANINHGPTIDRGDKHEDDNGDGNGNNNGDVGNRNGNLDMNVGGLMPIAREYTYQDFLKCQPLIFKGIEGVVGLTRWFEKMETVFHINNCPQKYQELVLRCAKMVIKEEDRVEKFIGGLPDNIQGNVITAEPTRLQDAIQIAKNLIDQNLKGYAARNA
ncbi:hypothetical protein Tco_0519121, partial [Tanacetum coccineum]